MIHYSLIGRCPFKRKSPAQAKATAKEIARLSFGKGMGIALLYRWKNIERSNAYVMRARGQHDILTKALRAFFSKRSCEQAEAAAEAAQDPEALPWATKDTVKASSVIRMFEKDVDKRASIRVHILCTPMQHYLNATFKADELSSRLGNAETVDPESNETRRLQDQVFESNMNFLSARRGRQVVLELFQMVRNFNSTAWQYWIGPPESRLRHAIRLLVPITWAWRRLVFELEEDDAHELMRACEIDFTPVFSAARIQNTVTRLDAGELIWMLGDT